MHNERRHRRWMDADKVSLLFSLSKRTAAGDVIDLCCMWACMLTPLSTDPTLQSNSWQYYPSIYVCVWMSNIHIEKRAERESVGWNREEGGLEREKDVALKKKRDRGRRRSIQQTERKEEVHFFFLHLSTQREIKRSEESEINSAYKRKMRRPVQLPPLSNPHPFSPPPALLFAAV